MTNIKNSSRLNVALYNKFLLKRNLFGRNPVRFWEILFWKIWLVPRCWWNHVWKKGFFEMFRLRNQIIFSKCSTWFKNCNVRSDCISEEYCTNAHKGIRILISDRILLSKTIQDKVITSGCLVVKNDLVTSFWKNSKVCPEFHLRLFNS